MSCFIICYILMPNAAVAKALLTTQAVKLQPGQPFTWSSGMQSPIYCDNRMLLSHPEVRTLIVDTFITMISAFSDVEGIAGVATGAIAWGALIADKMWLPFVYIRSKEKWHGRKNLVEWDITQADRYVVIEDLISTWGSSLSAIQAMQELDKKIISLWAIFSYGFPHTTDALKQAGCTHFVLTDYLTLMQQAAAMKYIDPTDMIILEKRRENPQVWQNN